MKPLRAPRLARLLAISCLIAAVITGPATVLAGPAAARFLPGLNRVKADKGEVYRKGCLLGHERLLEEADARAAAHREARVARAR